MTRFILFFSEASTKGFIALGFSAFVLVRSCHLPPSIRKATHTYNLNDMTG